VLVEEHAEVVLGVIVVEILLAREVVVAGTPATAEFDRVDPEVVEILAGLVERLSTERHREYAYVHVKRARRQGE